MKHSIKTILILGSTLLFLASCDKKLDELTPHNVNFESQQFATKSGYLKATIGNYALMGNYTEFSPYTQDYVWLNMSEFKGNNIRVIDLASSSEPTNYKELDAFTYSNSALKDYGYAYYYWRSAYKSLLSVNMVLKNTQAAETDVDILHAKGENLFLRAVLYFDLTRLFGKPYYQSPETNLSVPLILEPIEDISARPARATVKQVYDQITKDLLEAVTLMTKKASTNSYANKYAAYALLSRVNLYMGGTFTTPNNTYNKLAAQYADSVIANGGYTLLQGTAYANYYTASNQTNAETIWAINHTVIQSIVSRVFQYPTLSGYTGSWARPSANFLNLLQTGDLRKSYYKVKYYPNNTTDTIQVEKYGIGYTSIYTTSPVHYLRLAEIYLNRAEAKVKQGDNDGALADLNVIRVRAGLVAASGLSGQTLFDEILKQRRIELAFEGHNAYDYFRNGLPMVRDYASYNSTAITVQPTDGKVVMRIPQDEINYNNNLSQNEQ